METKELQNSASRVFLGNLKRDRIEPSEDYLVLKLAEELGEFVQSYLVHKKRCRPVKYLPARKSKKKLATELADVLGLVFVIATAHRIDIEDALVKKWITREWIEK
ncbi:MAG: MazG nucleotide pyrophosphohydrolase domain-containing protein [Patescibacteria group bacterium]